MLTLDKQALGALALEFFDDLDELGEEEFYSAIILVATLDDEGDIEVAMRTSGDNGIANIRVLQEAQLLETRTTIDAAVAEATE